MLPTTLLSLPPEITEKIGQSISAPRDVRSLAGTCRQMRDMLTRPMWNQMRFRGTENQVLNKFQNLRVIRVGSRAQKETYTLVRSIHIRIINVVPFGLDHINNVLPPYLMTALREAKNLRRLVFDIDDMGLLSQAVMEDLLVWVPELRLECLRMRTEVNLANSMLVKCAAGPMTELHLDAVVHQSTMTLIGRFRNVNKLGLRIRGLDGRLATSWSLNAEFLGDLSMGFPSLKTLILTEEPTNMNVGTLWEHWPPYARHLMHNCLDDLANIIRRYLPHLENFTFFLWQNRLWNAFCDLQVPEGAYNIPDDATFLICFRRLAERLVVDNPKLTKMGLLTNEDVFYEWNNGVCSSGLEQNANLNAFPFGFEESWN
ncbi:hypothetical protein F66182_2301 [Fusarium sp. NRRL 66182]|nr:hypothetical protein F66182_2301 [Fusarium sp. NRRL 66182]